LTAAGLVIRPEPLANALEQASTSLDSSRIWSRTSSRRACVSRAQYSKIWCPARRSSPLPTACSRRIPPPPFRRSLGRPNFRGQRGLNAPSCCGNALEAAPTIGASIALGREPRAPPGRRPQRVCIQSPSFDWWAVLGFEPVTNVCAALDKSPLAESFSCSPGCTVPGFTTPGAARAAEYLRRRDTDLTDR
jgi:hypothetical protein